ncbi:MAG TPA: DUF4040 domain-containing protein [Leptolyngbyaceae cyanobacterium]
MNDSYLYAIVALLPLSSLMLLLQTNPYHALVIQGIAGAIAALVFAVLGAADVALTQALMGTLLATTLYAIAVRSSLVMRLGVLEDGAIEADRDPHFAQLINDLRKIFGKHYMRLELVPYTNPQALHRALSEKEVHATCARLGQHNQDYSLDEDEQQPYHTKIRVRRIYDILQTELSSPATSLTYINAPDSGEEKH